MRTKWAIRRDQKAVSPVIATILMVAITVVLAAVLYVMVQGLVQGPGATPQLVGVNVDRSGANWKLTIASAPSAPTVSEVRLVITDGDGNLLLSRMLDAIVAADNASWNKIGADATILQGGDYILLDTSTYPSNSEYQLVGDAGVMAKGDLFA